MQAIGLFPYWNDNRALLAELVQPLREEDLEFQPAPGLSSLGAVLRHIIVAEEHWWHGGIHGEPFEQWRPADWDRYTDEEKGAHRTRRFPTVASIIEGLRNAPAPIVGFLQDLDAWALCEKRRSTWGKENTLRWIFWHLVGHDQHHRGQVYTRVRMLGYEPPSTFPRDLPRTHDTLWGPQTLHHTLWYTREHAVHHRAQLFLRMRMLGRTPPEI